LDFWDAGSSKVQSGIGIGSFLNNPPAALLSTHKRVKIESTNGSERDHPFPVSQCAQDLGIHFGKEGMNEALMLA
jgi:hypothetical protein